MTLPVYVDNSSSLHFVPKVPAIPPVLGIDVWWPYASSLRTLLMISQTYPAASDLSFDLNGFITNGNSIPLYSVVSLIFLLALLSILFAPCVSYDFYRKRKEELGRKKDGQRNSKRISTHAPNGKDQEDNTKITNRQSRIEDGNEMRVYSDGQKRNALLFFVFTSILMISFQVIIISGNYYINSGLINFKLKTLETLRGLGNASTVLRNYITSYTPSDYTNAFTESIDKTQLNAYILRDIQSTYTETESVFENYSDSVQKFNSKMSALNQEKSSVSSTLAYLSTVISQSTGFTDTNVQCNLSTAKSGKVLQPLQINMNMDTLPNLLSYQLNAAEDSLSQFRNIFQSYIGSAVNPIVENIASNLTASYNLFSNIVPAYLDQISSKMDSAVYNFLSQFNIFANWNAWRSVGTVYIILAVFFAVFISTAMVVFGQYQYLRCLNVVNLVLIMLIWTVCGITLLFSYSSGELCSLIETDRFNTWSQNENSFTSALPKNYDFGALVDAAFMARGSCLSENSEALVMLALNFSAYQSNDVCGSTCATAIRNMQNFQTLAANTLASSIKLNDMGGAFNLWYNQAMNVLDAAQQAYESKNPDSIPLSAYVNAENQDLFFSANAMSDFANLLLSGSFDWQNSDFIFTPASADPAIQTQCVSNFKTNAANSANGSSSITAPINTAINEVRRTVSNMKSVRNEFISSILDVKLDLQFIKFLNATKLSKTAQRVYAYEYLNFTVQGAALASLLPIYNSIGCSKIAQDSLVAQNYLCLHMQVGMDSTFWGLFLLGLIYAFNFLAINACIERMGDDIRWKVLAIVLKHHYNAEKPTGFRKSKSKLYISEEAFNVEFSQDNLV